MAYTAPVFVKKALRARASKASGGKTWQLRMCARQAVRDAFSDSPLEHTASASRACASDYYCHLPSFAAHNKPYHEAHGGFLQYL